MKKGDKLHTCIREVSPMFAYLLELRFFFFKCGLAAFFVGWSLVGVEFGSFSPSLVGVSVAVY